MGLHTNALPVLLLIVLVLLHDDVVVGLPAGTSSTTCDLCKTIITTISAELDSSFSEAQVALYLKLACSAFNLDSWCVKNVFPNVHDIFLALQSNKTDDIICERVKLCKFKVTAIDGDVLFADRDVLYTIRELDDHTLQHIPFGTVAHPELPNGIVYGLSCSVDYCAVLLVSENNGQFTYGTTALSPYQQVHQVLPAGDWYGPWFDIMTEEFWMATGTTRQLIFGLFEPKLGVWDPKITMRLVNVRSDSELLSGQILDRILYFTVRDDPHVYLLDLTLRISIGNFSSVNNTMLVGNPVTNELYGYAPNRDGVWRWSNDTARTRITVGNINLTGATPVASSTVNPVKNTMWISLWAGQDAWLRVDLTKTTENVAWAPSGNLDGLFDFNPYTITSEQV